jgi:glycosyltransferase involved in cell wall biosynthesis
MNVPAPSSTHLVIIPSYNTGPKLTQTVREACRYWNPVWVVLDGSDDGSELGLQALADQNTALRIFSVPVNRGKGAAVLHGLREADRLHFTHALTMDADGQHPAAFIPEFMAVSQANLDALILGKPIFDETAPRRRVRGRRISNWWANLESLWCGIGDSLFGLRVYPIRNLRSIMEGTRWMRRFDFDVEAAVRLCWRGVRPINVPTPTRYFSPEEGGVSHFQNRRDNILLSGMHIRLVLGFIWRLPFLSWRRFKSWRRLSR